MNICNNNRIMNSTNTCGKVCNWPATKCVCLFKDFLFSKGFKERFDKQCSHCNTTSCFPCQHRSWPSDLSCHISHHCMSCYFALSAYCTLWAFPTLLGSTCILKAWIPPLEWLPVSPEGTYRRNMRLTFAWYCLLRFQKHPTLPGGKARS